VVVASSCAFKRLLQDNTRYFCGLLTVVGIILLLSLYPQSIPGSSYLSWGFRKRTIKMKGRGNDEYEIEE
jgi:hypothetical protein